MRAAPAFQVRLHRFGVWRSAVWLLAVLGLATIAAWLVTREPPIHPGVWIAAILSAAALTGSAATLARTPPVDLRWDGLVWHLGPSAGGPVPGDVIVAVDLGAWMLLRFVPAMPGARPRVTWLPVQRRGIEAQWHALRCSVYSPRPAPGDGDSTIGP